MPRVPDEVLLRTGQLVRFFHSTSYASAYRRTFKDPAACWPDLEPQVQQAAARDTIPVDFSLELLLARRA